MSVGYRLEGLGGGLGVGALEDDLLRALAISLEDDPGGRGGRRHGGQRVCPEARALGGRVGMAGAGGYDEGA